jgi:hypothetical protein
MFRAGASNSAGDKKQGTAEVPRGLEKDQEGIETRKQMLARRRKECECEEVDVALAPVMKIPVPYVFYPNQYKTFRALFPRVNVDSGLNYVHHDHPVAHTATLVGIRHLQSMLKPGEVACDLHGNPGGNERYNRFQSSRLRKRPNLPTPPLIETMVGMNSAADAVRAVTKWGPEQDEFGVRRWFKGGIDSVPEGLYDSFLSVHTLYYYSMQDVCKLLNKPGNKGKRMMALVNYSKENSGRLYGELDFHKSGGHTTQISPNGEKYHHPDIDPWFTNSSYRKNFSTSFDAISWTTHNVGGPLYVVTITACPYKLAHGVNYDPPGAPTLRVEKDGSFLGLVKVCGRNVQLKITNAELAQELRHFMTFRDRNDPQVFQDLVVKARRVTGSDVVTGSRQYYVADGQLQDHVVYAYLVDAPGDLELLQGVKVLRGDLLEPLSEALSFDGKVDKASLTSALGNWFLGGKPTAKAALANRRNKVRTREALGNSGGLLPSQRT